jgi:predicted  nucleic acid-binding Zn-ribbon protein
MKTWDITRATLEKNKHPNYGEHIHLFTALVKCPDCGKILSSTLSYKHSGTPKQKNYYFLTCKNSSCKSKGLHYNCDRIEQKLLLVLDELTIYMFNNRNEILTSNSKKSKEIKEIEKAIDKLKLQEKRLVDLYINSSVNVETINTKNEAIKKEITNLIKKKDSISPDDDKEATIELLKKLERSIEDNSVTFYKNYFVYIWNMLNKKAKKELINRFISSLSIVRTGNYDIEITNIKFTDELISKSNSEFIDYLKSISQHNLKFKKII